MGVSQNSESRWLTNMAVDRYCNSGAYNGFEWSVGRLSVTQRTNKHFKDTTQFKNGSIIIETASEIGTILGIGGGSETTEPIDKISFIDAANNATSVFSPVPSIDCATPCITGDFPAVFPASEEGLAANSGKAKRMRLGN